METKSQIAVKRSSITVHVYGYIIHGNLGLRSQAVFYVFLSMSTVYVKRPIFASFLGLQHFCPSGIQH